MRRLITLLALAAAALLALAGPASAHVTVSSADAQQGGYGVLTFRVPTESATASTTKLTVSFPTSTPLAFVAVQPTPGWTTVTRTSTLRTPITTDDGKVTKAVSQVTWTAQRSAAIKPGEFQQFAVEAGPFPKRSSMSFPAVQTYSDGTVVRWIERQAPGSSTEPEHPAPTLDLAVASSADGDSADGSTGGSASDSDGGSTTGSTAAEPATSGADRVAAGPAGDTGPVVLSIIALVLAAGALGVAVVGRARRSGS